MTRVLILLFTLVALGAQRPRTPPEPPCDEHSDKARCPDGPDSALEASGEARIPPGDYCKKADVPIRPSETRAHPCSCTFTCQIDGDGNVTGEQEGQDCSAYCHKNRRVCTCHVESPCPGTGWQALRSMDREIVAVRR